MKKILLITLTLFVSNSFGQTFDYLTDSAFKAFQGKKYRQAINLYNQALKIDHENHFIYNKISLMYYYLDNLDSAIVYCDLTLNKSPNDTTALYQRGHCYLDKGNYQKALDDFTLSFEMTNNRNSNACFNIGKCYFEIGNINKAIEFYKKTLMLEPNDKYSYYELGYCYASLSKPDKDNSLKYYSSAIDQDKSYYDAYFNRGLLYATQFKDYKNAHLDLERSIEIRPQNKLSYLYNGILYREEENFDKAKDMFSKLIEFYPNYADAYFERAITWYKIGILNMVCKDLEKAEILGYSKAIEIKKQVCK